MCIVSWLFIACEFFLMVNSSEGDLDLYFWLDCDQVLKTLKCYLFEEIYVGKMSGCNMLMLID
jgi:hypothetical protein